MINFNKVDHLSILIFNPLIWHVQQSCNTHPHKSLGIKTAQEFMPQFSEELKFSPSIITFVM